MIADTALEWRSVPILSMLGPVIRCFLRAGPGSLVVIWVAFHGDVLRRVKALLMGPEGK